MTVLRHNKPCKQCPFRQKAAPGWLGTSSPEEFVEQVMGQTDMPCHATIDYEKPDWIEQLETASQCAGALIFLKNSGHRDCQGELGKRVAGTKTDYTNVLLGPGHFVAYHKRQI